MRECKFLSTSDVKHVWKKQLTETTRQLKLGADRMRGGEVMELIDGVEVVRVFDLSSRLSI